MIKDNKATILIVDDKPANIIALEALLTAWDRIVLNASGGADALKIALNTDIDLIILDVQMPDMDGFEVAQVLKLNNRTKDIPILFASAEKKEYNSIIKGFEEGAVDYLFKPLDPEIVRAKVSVLLKLQLQKKELIEKNLSLEKSALLINNSSDIIGIIDAETLMIEEINQAFTYILGYSQEEGKASSLASLLGETDRNIVKELAGQNNGKFSFETPVYCKDKSIKYLQWNVTAKYGKWFVNARDITRQKELNAELEKQTRELQEHKSELIITNEELREQTKKLIESEEELLLQHQKLLDSNARLEEQAQALEEVKNEIQKKAEELAITSKFKSEFLANMSHELRTPLNSILLLSQLLSENQDKNMTDEQVEFAGIIYKSGNGLLALINEILDLSKIESGKMDIDYEEITTRSVIYDMSSIFLPVARKKNLSFIISESEGFPASFITDTKRLEQVLKNLLSNAFKFTEKGSVELTLRNVPAAEAKAIGFEGQELLAFSVKDTGIGIPASKQQVIFEAFQQADGSTRRKYGGTGLGLSISRKIVGMLGGVMILESEEWKGSTFKVYLPVKEKNVLENRDNNAASGDKVYN